MQGLRRSYAIDCNQKNRSDKQKKDFTLSTVLKTGRKGTKCPQTEILLHYIYCQTARFRISSKHKRR